MRLHHRPCWSLTLLGLHLNSHLSVPAPFFFSSLFFLFLSRRNRILIFLSLFFFATVNAAFSSSNSVVSFISRCDAFTLRDISVSSDQRAFEAWIFFQNTGWYFLPPASPTQLLVWWTNTSPLAEEDEEGFLVLSSSSVYLVNVSPWSLYNGIILRSNHAFFTWLYHRRPWLKGCLNVWSALGRSVPVACPLCAGC